MGYSEKMQQVQQAYFEREPEPIPEPIQEVETSNCEECICENKFEGVEVDGIDQAYVWARTFIPSWLMGLMLLIGAFVVLKSTLAKFGINIRLVQMEKKK